MVVTPLRQNAPLVRLGRRVGVFSDVHGEIRALTRALDICRDAGVNTIMLLGDLFDMADQADACARALAGWPVVGVYGNHEHELTVAALAGEINMEDQTLDLLAQLREEVRIEDAMLTHDAIAWSGADPLSSMFTRDDTDSEGAQARFTFAGHTHFRAVRTEHGPVEIRRGRIRLSERRRYLINPGALAVGQFAIWDREEHTLQFHQLDDWQL